MKIVTYDQEGNIVEEREVEDVEQPEEFKQIPQSALDNLSEKLNDLSVNSISEVKDALKEFIGSIQ